MRTTLVKHSDRLEQLETVIEAAGQARGAALMEIRDSKLYKQTYPSFEQYCETRWNISKRTAYYEIASVKGILRDRTKEKVHLGAHISKKNERDTDIEMVPAYEAKREPPVPGPTIDKPAPVCKMASVTSEFIGGVLYLNDIFERSSINRQEIKDFVIGEGKKQIGPELVYLISNLNKLKTELEKM